MRANCRVARHLEHTRDHRFAQTVAEAPRFHMHLQPVDPHHLHQKHFGDALNADMVQRFRYVPMR